MTQIEEAVSRAIVGSILGTAVGDAMGLPYEGLSSRRALRMLGPPDRYRLLLGRGMVSDDTEHTCMVAQTLIGAGGDPALFRRIFAWRLRLWLLSLPVGTGLATLKATLRLWCGFPSDRSGVWSAGNGPAMRSAVIGAAVTDIEQLQALVKASTRITHRDPKAEWGALAVAIAARQSAIGNNSAAQYLSEIHRLLPNEASELKGLLEQSAASGTRGDEPRVFAESIGLRNRVGGYVYHTVPVAVQAWLRYPIDFRNAITGLIRCGGDTDTLAAIGGGIIGAGVGREGIPREWLDRLTDWPRSVAWMERLGERLGSAQASGTGQIPPRLPVPPLVLRNLFLISVVLAHGFRRLLPPY
jgi:ADP-ribosylglycohydrolase